MVGKDLIMATLFGSGGSSGGGGWPEVPNDGATYLYITLVEGRTSPMLGVGVNGTVTVDWGDGTEPDVLTGTSVGTTRWTPKHAYHEPGNYVIRLFVDGEMAFAGESSANKGPYILRNEVNLNATNRTYQTALKKVEIGNGVTSIGNYAFFNCHALDSVVLPDGIASIGTGGFSNCYSLTSVVLPASVTSILGNAFYNCHGMICFDFTTCTAVPTLNSNTAFSGVMDDCEIRVPASLYDEWIAATNWATYADYIKAY